MSFSSCFCLLPFPSIFSPKSCFRWQCLCKMWPIQLAFLLLLYIVRPFPPWHFVILFHFSHDQSNWSSLSFSSTMFQNHPGISNLLSEVSKFQHQTNLCSKCSTLLVSSLNLGPVCWQRESSSGSGNPGFNFTCYTMHHLLCYQNSCNTPHTGCFLIYHNLHLGWLPWDSQNHGFLHIHFHFKR